jgi:thiol-disulfide isomerase/thioredoxin
MVGCPSDDQPVSSVDAPGWWRVELQTREGPIPFLLRIDPSGQSSGLRFGNELVPADFARLPSGEVRLTFPQYLTRLRLESAESGRLKGVFTAPGFPLPAYTLPVVARPIEEPSDDALQASPGEDPSVDVTGRWACEVDQMGLTQMVFRQEADGRISGSITPQNFSDLRYAWGRVEGRTLRLASFDGQRNYLVRAQVSPDGERIEGRFYAPHRFSASFRGTRDPDFELPPQAVSVRPGYRRLDLEVLDDDRYDDKVVLVELMGSWCPNCADFQRVLRSLYERHHADGLEVVALAYEFSDPRTAERQVEGFKRLHGVQWPVHVMPAFDAQSWELVMPRALQGVTGFPVVVLLDRSHRIRKVYTGTRGPAAEGAHRQRRELEASIARLLDVDPESDSRHRP